jgi:threonine/homoserine/homoserine lactone efflux protein
LFTEGCASRLVNATIVLGASGIAAFLQQRPHWMRWQRRVTGSLLGAAGLKLAMDAPAHAH